MAGRVRKKVAIVGAGICGLSTAVRLQAADPCLDITIIAEKFSPETTSDVAAGFWEPIFMRDTPIENQKRWGKVTFDYLKTFLETEQASHLGITYCSGYFLADEIINEKPFEDIYIRQIKLSEEDLRRNFPDDIKDGYLITSIMFCCTPYMQVILKQFQQKGGKIVEKKVKSFDEFAGKFDVVVNCSGLGARDLCKDKTIEPVRGQIIKIRAPWLKHFYMVERHEEIKKERPCYIFPRFNDVVVGGTIQFGNWNTDVDERDTQYILERVSEFEPTIKNAEIIKICAGLRPVRKAVRLEKEIMAVKTEYGSVLKLPVVHNYGHGGGGLSTFWGCAGEARDLVQNSLLFSSL